MTRITQGFGALLDVYVHQFRVQTSTELSDIHPHYRTVDNVAMLDKDIGALVQVCGQVDKILHQGCDATPATYAQSRILSMLVGANVTALKVHLPMIAAADLRYIQGPRVAVLDQARLKASAKRLRAIDDLFIHNATTLMAATQDALAAVFPQPIPQPIPPPPPPPQPGPGPRPDPDFDVAEAQHAQGQPQTLTQNDFDAAVDAHFARYEVPVAAPHDQYQLVIGAVPQNPVACTAYIRQQQWEAYLDAYAIAKGRAANTCHGQTVANGPVTG